MLSLIWEPWRTRSSATTFMHGNRLPVGKDRANSNLVAAFVYERHGGS
ncbi:MAG: hypothetical protein R3E96_03080 [Planctomycetota bacterium]